MEVGRGNSAVFGKIGLIGTRLLTHGWCQFRCDHELSICFDFGGGNFSQVSMREPTFHDFVLVSKTREVFCG